MKKKYRMVRVKEKFIEGRDQWWSATMKKWYKVYVRECGEYLAFSGLKVRRVITKTRKKRKP